MESFDWFKILTTSLFFSILAQNPITRNFKLGFWKTWIKFTLHDQKGIKWEVLRLQIYLRIKCPENRFLVDFHLLIYSFICFSCLSFHRNHFKLLIWVIVQNLNHLTRLKKLVVKTVVPKLRRRPERFRCLLGFTFSWPRNHMSIFLQKICERQFTDLTLSFYLSYLWNIPGTVTFIDLASSIISSSVICDFESYFISINIIWILFRSWFTYIFICWW